MADYKSARRALGVVPQELVYDPFFTVRETLRIQSGYFGLRKNDDWIDEILFNLGLADKANSNMRALSGGMKRRVLVAQALVHRPPVIVLDEPTAGVDVDLRRTLWEFISRLNKAGHTIMLTTHYLEEAEACAAASPCSGRPRRGAGHHPGAAGARGRRGPGRRLRAHHASGRRPRRPQPATRRDPQ